MVNPSASKWHRSTCLLRLEAVNAKNRIDRKRRIKQLFARSLCPPISSLKWKKTLLLRNLHLNLSILKLLRGLKAGNEQVCRVNRQHFKNHRLLHLKRPKCQTSVTHTMAWSPHPQKSLLPSSLSSYQLKTEALKRSKSSKRSWRLIRSKWIRSLVSKPHQSRWRRAWSFLTEWNLIRKLHWPSGSVWLAISAVSNESYLTKLSKKKSECR